MILCNDNSAVADPDLDIVSRDIAHISSELESLLSRRSIQEKLSEDDGGDGTDPKILGEAGGLLGEDDTDDRLLFTDKSTGSTCVGGHSASSELMIKTGDTLGAGTNVPSAGERCLRSADRLRPPHMGRYDVWTNI